MTNNKQAKKNQESAGKSNSKKQTGLSLQSQKTPASPAAPAVPVAPSAPASPAVPAKVQKPEIIDPAAISKRLETATIKIRKEIGGVAKSFCKIGFELYKVREEKLYIAQNFNTVADYGEKILGFQKSSVANYISIAERFSVKKDDKPTAQLLPEFANFSYGQLSLMLSIPSEKLPEITPDKTCSEIRKIKKTVKATPATPAAPATPATPATPAAPSGSSFGVVSGSGAASGSVNSDNHVRYLVAWHYKNDTEPLKSATLTIAADKTDKIYKEICVLLNNDWYDFGRDGDSLTVSLVNNSGGDSK